MHQKIFCLKSFEKESQFLLMKDIANLGNVPVLLLYRLYKLHLKVLSWLLETKICFLNDILLWNAVNSVRNA